MTDSITFYWRHNTTLVSGSLKKQLECIFCHQNFLKHGLKRAEYVKLYAETKCLKFLSKYFYINVK